MIKIKNKNFKKGFTLIELLIVIAIIGIMTSALFVSMSKSGTTNSLKVASRQLAGAIREAQNYALTGKQKEKDLYPCAFRLSVESVSNDGAYYKIDYAPRPIEQNCGEIYESGYTFDESFVGPIKFAGVEMVTGEDVVFTVPHAKYTSIDPDQTEFILEKKGKEYKVIVYSSGRIEEVGPGEE